MDREQGIKLMQELLKRVVERQRPIFYHCELSAAIKIDGEIASDGARADPGTVGHPGARHHERPADQGIRRHQGVQFAIAPPGIGRFRVSAFVQQSHVAASSASSTPRSPRSRNWTCRRSSKRWCCPSAPRDHRRRHRLGKVDTLASMLDTAMTRRAATSSRSRTRSNTCTAQGLRGHAS